MSGLVEALTNHLTIVILCAVLLSQTIIILIELYALITIGNPLKEGLELWVEILRQRDRS